MAEQVYKTVRLQFWVFQKPSDVPNSILTIYTVLKKLGESGDDIVSDADLLAQKGNAIS